MAIIFIEKARIGMTIGKDMYSGTGAKLLTVGTVLTKNQISMLMKHNVRTIVSLRKKLLKERKWSLFRGGIL